MTLQRYEEYEYRTRTLREHLITANRFVEMVRSVEDVPDEYLFVRSSIKPEIGTSMYCVPYPYRKSAYDAILEWKAQSDDGSGKLTDEDKEAWHDLVMKRCESILSNWISNESLVALDSTGDIGMFLNLITGKIDPFLYSRTVGIDIIQLPITPQEYLLERSMNTFNGTPVEYHKLAKYFTFYRDRIMLSMNIRYMTPDGDYWRSEGVPIDLTTSQPYTTKHTRDIINYIQATYAAKTRVIVIS